MCTLLAVALSEEPDAIRQLVEDRLEQPLRSALRWSDDVDREADGVVLVTDDPAHPGITRLIRRVRSKHAPDRVVVLGWNASQGWSQALRISVGAVYLLPGEWELARHEVSRLLRQAASVYPLGLTLRRGLPHSLHLALREVLTRSGTPAGAAPPRNVTRLAGDRGIDRSNLARQAQRSVVDLGLVCELSLLRWLWLRIILEPEASANQLAHMAGFSTKRGLRSWVRRVAGRPLGRLKTLQVGAVEERLRDALKAVSEAGS